MGGSGEWWRLTFTFEGEDEVLVDDQDDHWQAQEIYMQMFNPPHPGRIVKEAITAILLSVTAFAEHLGISRVNLSRILNERAGISAEMSIKFSQAFGQDAPDIWFKMQNDYDFWQASQVKRSAISPLKIAA